jgi:hypothetical protein
MKWLLVLAASTTVEGHLLRHKLRQPDAETQLKEAHQRTIAAEQTLKANLWETKHLTAKIAEQEDSSAHEQKIEQHEKTVANETESKALAAFLGSMWREMHQFGGPFYVEHLKEELTSLAADRKQLEANLKAAQDEEHELNHLRQSISNADEDSDSEEDEEDDEEAKPVAMSVDAGSNEKQIDTTAASKTLRHSAEAYSAGIDETAKQFGHLVNQGLSAGAPTRTGLYPVDLSGGTPLGYVSAHAAKSVADAEAAQQLTGKIQLHGDGSDDDSASTQAAAAVKHMSHAAVDAGLKSTVNQFEHFRTHGILAGAATPREGLYPVNLGVEKQPMDAEVSVAAQKSEDASAEDADSGVAEVSHAAAAAGLDSGVTHMSHAAIAAGLDATLKQVGDFGKSGLATGDKREGLYPVDLSAQQAADSAHSEDVHTQTAKDDDDDDDSDDQEDDDASPKEAAASTGSAWHENIAQGISKGLGKTMQQFQNFQEGSVGGPVRTGVYPVKLAMNQQA